MRKTIATVLLVMLLLSGACPAIAAGESASANYKLRPGDILAITVLGYDEFVPPANANGPTGFLVRPDGRFSFPLIGEVNVQDVTVAELTEILRVRLSEYLLEPRVTVNLGRLGGTRVYVLGEVVKPGSYEIDKARSLLDAISAAGGPTKDAAKRNVYVVQRNNPDKYRKVNLLAILTKGDMSQNIALSEGDAIYLTSNNRIVFARDIQPLLLSAYYFDRMTRDR